MNKWMNWSIKLRIDKYTTAKSDGYLTKYSCLILICISLWCCKMVKSKQLSRTSVKSPFSHLRLFSLIYHQQTKDMRNLDCRSVLVTFHYMCMLLLPYCQWTQKQQTEIVDCSAPTPVYVSLYTNQMITLKQ